MFKRPFGASFAAIITAGAALASATRVLWDIQDVRTINRPGRRPYKVGRAYGYSTGRDYSGARNGERECARRRRQIERGQLKAENGLAT